MNNEIIQEKIYELLGEFGEDLANEHTEVCTTIAQIINSAPVDMPANKLVAAILQHVDMRYISIISTMVQYTLPDGAAHIHNVDPDLVIFNHLSHYLILKDEQDETSMGGNPNHLH